MDIFKKFFKIVSDRFRNILIYIIDIIIFTSSVFVQVSFEYELRRKIKKLIYIEYLSFVIYNKPFSLRISQFHHKYNSIELLYLYIWKFTLFLIM